MFRKVKYRGTSGKIQNIFIEVSEIPQNHRMANSRDFNQLNI